MVMVTVRVRVRVRVGVRVRVRVRNSRSVRIGGRVSGWNSGTVRVTAGAGKRSGRTRPTLALYYQHSYSYTGTHTRWHAY